MHILRVQAFGTLKVLYSFPLLLQSETTFANSCLPPWAQLFTTNDVVS